MPAQRGGVSSRVRALGPVVLGGLVAFAAVMVAPAVATAGIADGDSIRSVNIGMPARGDIAALSFDVTAARRGRRPGRVGLSVRVPRALRSQVGVLVTVSNQSRRRRFTVYVLRRRGVTRALASGARARVAVRVRGVDRTIKVRNIERAIDALQNLDEDLLSRICASRARRVRKLLGLRGTGASLLANAIKAVLCGQGDEDDVKLLADLGIVVPVDGQGQPIPPTPDPTPTPPGPPPPPTPRVSFACVPFAGNPFEGVCTASGGPFDAVRIRGTGDQVFSQCFSDTARCQVEQSGQPNNSVLFLFRGGTTSTGPLNLRSANQTYNRWGALILERSTDGGQTFQDVARFMP
jgi:hypothetical protein